MAQVAQKEAITIEISLASSPFDESLSYIEEYLRERFSTCDHRELMGGKGSVTVDLGVLDLCRSGDEREYIKHWRDQDAIYPIRLDHTHIILGPLYQPSRGGACPLCLEQRWRLNRASDWLDRGKGEQLLASTRRMLAFESNALLTPFALEAMWEVMVFALSQKHTGQMHNQLYALELRSLNVTSYQLIPNALCPVCAVSTSGMLQNTTVQLAPRPKQQVTNYHPTPASAYDLAEKDYLNPICGMLGNNYHLSDDHTIDAPSIGRFAVQASNNALFRMHWGSHGRSYSLQTGILEGLERYAWARPRKQHAVVFDSYQHLEHDALHPSEVGLYSPEFYQAHPDSYTTFSSDFATHWIWGYSFRKARPVLVLEQFVYPSRYDTPKFVNTTTSGCAIGGSIEEALLFGLVELIERDGLMLTWNTKTSPRRVNIRHCSDSRILRLLDRFEKRGYDVHLLDTRFDMPIPSVVAVAVLRTFDPEKMKIAVSVGCGASLTPEKAVLSALAESGYWIDNVHVEDHVDEMRAMVQDPGKVLAVIDHGLAYGLPEAAPRTAFLYQNPQECSFDACYAEWRAQYPQSLDLRDDLLYCIHTILNMGMDVIAVDLTGSEHERVGLKTCKVVVPGLLPIDFGADCVRVLDLPRLRTAPRSAGYLKSDFDPANYNRDPHPFT